MAHTLLFLWVFLTSLVGRLFQEPEPVLLVHSSALEKGTYLGWQGSHPQWSGQANPVDWIACQWDWPASPRGEWELSLADGSRLRGKPIGGTEDILEWESSIPGYAGGKIDLLEVRELKRTEVFLVPSSQDQLVLQTPQGNRDQHQGWLLATDAKGIVFEEAGGANHYLWNQIQHLRLHAEAGPSHSNNPWITFCDGSLLRAELLASTGAYVKVRLGAGLVVQIPLTSVFRIRRGDQQIIDLSLRPFTQTSWVKKTTIPRQPKRNLSVEGRPLQVADKIWPQGIGVFAPTTFAFHLEKPGTLLFQVGIDDETKSFHRRQAVTLRIRQNQEILWEEVWKAERSSTPRLIPLSKPGALSFEVVGEASGGHVDWLDPVIWSPPAAKQLD